MAQPPTTPPPPPPGTPGTPPPPPSGAPSGAGRRPGSVTAAGILLIVLGAFAAIGGILILIGGAILAGGDFGPLTDQFGDVLGAAAGIAVVIGLLVIGYAVVKIIAGAKVFALKNAWRITGIALCAVAMVGWVIILIGSFQGQQTQTIDPTTFEFTTVGTGPDIGGIIFALLFLGANTVCLVLLARAGHAFRR